MWQDENQRLGKQRCTPWGYRLHQLSDLVSFGGLLLLIGILISLPLVAIFGTFRFSLLWWLVVPFLLDFCGDFLYFYSCRLAQRKNFHYDYEAQRSTWVENGEPRSYPPESDLRGRMQGNPIP